MRTATALAVTLLAPIVLVAAGAESTRSDRVDIPPSTLQVADVTERQLPPEADSPDPARVTARPPLTADAGNGEAGDVTKTERASNQDQPLANSSAQNDLLAETTFTTLVETSVAAGLPDPVCIERAGPSGLSDFFDLGDPILGADYQRAFTLPDGRVLWLFQDAFLPTSHGPTLVHNVGLLQSGPCFQLLRTGSADHPAPYLLPELTDQFDRWFWPLGGGVGDDGNLHVFAAEVRERSSGYLIRTEPVATWVVSIELDDFTVVGAQPAPNPSNDLYGWSVVSQGDHTYLYAHCYRQFGWDLFPFAETPFRAHDWSCGPDVTVARIPRSDFDATPEYWNGSIWTTDPADAVPVIQREGRTVNPTQVALHDGNLVAVTKVGDWWGDTVYLDVAPAAEGPWRTYATITVRPECDRCNTYFASFVPYGANETSLVVGLSVNTWDGDDLEHYSPRFRYVPAPPRNTPVATERPDDVSGVA